MKRSNHQRKLVPLIVGLSSIGIVSIPLQSSAIDLQPLKESWYIGGDVGVSRLDPQSENVDIEMSGDKGVAKKIYTGTKITDSIGIEAFWADFGDTKLETPLGDANVGYSGYGASVKYEPMTINGNITPYAKVGVAKINTDAEGNLTVNQLNDATMFVGAGLEYNITDSVRIRSEYERYDEDLDHFSLGINWRPVLKKKVKKKPIPAALPIVQEPEQVVQTVVQPIVQPVIVSQPAPKPLPPPVVKPKPPKPPKPKPKPLTEHVVKKTLTGGSYFASGKYKLRLSGENALKKMIRDLKRDGLSSQYITIIGHTDSVGSDRANQKLSENRARSVARFMESQGIPGHLITVHGRGEAEPIAHNGTKAGRAKNRRVEVIIRADKRFYR